MKTLSIILLLCLSTISQAQVKAVIKGTKEAAVGNLIILNNEDSLGVNKKWVLPSVVSDQVAECGPSIFFSINKPGTYKFLLICADLTAAIDYAEHTITITGSVPTPPEIPAPVVPGFSSLRKASSKGILELNDPSTNLLLKKNLTEATLAVVSDSLPVAKSRVQGTIDNTMLMRVGGSRNKDWLFLWRVPVNLELDKIQFTTTKDYIGAVEAVISTF